MTGDPHPSSVTLWFEQLRAGDPDSAGKLWERFFDRLVAHARGELSNANRRVADEEDIAAGVMAALCQCADRGKLPSIENRDDLWRLLLAWTRHDIIDHVRKDRRIKRGAGNVRGDSIFDSSFDGLDQQGDGGLTADTLLEMDEQYELLLNRLPDPKLRRIAIDKMNGYTNAQLAQRLEVTPRTIERKLALIRGFWSH